MKKIALLLSLASVVTVAMADDQRVTAVSQIDSFRERAVEHPTRGNVAAYQLAQQAMLAMATGVSQVEVDTLRDRVLKDPTPGNIKAYLDWQHAELDIAHIAAIRAEHE
jgi:hypothetical protein